MKKIVNFTFMRIVSVLGVIFVALCFFACNSNKEDEYQPLAIENYAEVAVDDTTQLTITGGSGNIVVEENDKVGISTTQNDKHVKHKHATANLFDGKFYRRRNKH